MKRERYTGAAHWSNDLFSSGFKSCTTSGFGAGLHWARIFKPSRITAVFQASYVFLYKLAASRAQAGQWEWCHLTSASLAHMASSTAPFGKDAIFTCSANWHYNVACVDCVIMVPEHTLDSSAFRTARAKNLPTGLERCNSCLLRFTCLCGIWTHRSWVNCQLSCRRCTQLEIWRTMIVCSLTILAEVVLCMWSLYREPNQAQHARKEKVGLKTDMLRFFKIHFAVCLELLQPGLLYCHTSSSPENCGKAG